MFLQRTQRNGCYNHKDYALLKKRLEIIQAVFLSLYQFRILIEQFLFIYECSWSKRLSSLLSVVGVNRDW
jgi:hypothetical protein